MTHGMISVNHLTRQFGPRIAVDSLTFTVQPGEVVGFLGPNGAGKSTTMKMITGFMPATSGTAEVAGYDVFKNPIEVKKNIGFLPENPPVYLEMPVIEYLKFCARLHFVPENKITTAVNSVIEKTFLGDVRNRIIGNLSKGYRQRVGLAQAMVHNPKVLILDEPTVGLDPKQIIEIRQLIKSLAGDHTVILSSHILPEVTATCQRIIVINRGKIVAEDSIERLSIRMKQGADFTLKVLNPKPAGIEMISKIQGVSSVKSDGNLIHVIFKDSQDVIKATVIDLSARFCAQRRGNRTALQSTASGLSPSGRLQGSRQ